MSKLVQISQSEYDPAAFARFAPGAGFTLDNARARGLKVLPRCAFVRDYLAKHPEFRDVMAAGS